MGHITQIGNILRITVESRREVAEHVQHSSQWHDYSAQQLEPRNEVNLLSQTSDLIPATKHVPWDVLCRLE